MRAPRACLLVARACARRGHCPVSYARGLWFLANDTSPPSYHRRIFMVNDMSATPKPPAWRGPIRQSWSDDEVIVRLLVDTWTLTTGRTLRDAPPCELTEEELINFWADD